VHEGWRPIVVSIRNAYHNKGKWLHRYPRWAGIRADERSISSDLIVGRKAAGQRGLPQPGFACLHFPGCHPGHRCDESQSSPQKKRKVYSTPISLRIMRGRCRAGVWSQARHFHRPAQFADAPGLVLSRHCPVF